MMRAAILYGKEDVRVEEVALPEVERGEVRIRIGAALTCGTDVKVFRRGYHAAMLKPPIRFGHELAGVVDAVGEGVTDWKVGDRVIPANSAPCGNCFFCTKNRPELCEDLLFLNGAYAEYITVPERIVQKNMLPIPDGLSDSQAAMTEPLACVVYGMQDMPVEAGETVVVLGLGPIGLMFVRLCHLAGANVIAFGRRRSRLELAAELGASQVYDAETIVDPVSMLRAVMNGGRGADVVIECVGKPEAWETAVALARKGGRVSLFGGCPSNTFVSIDTHRIHYDELTLRGTFHHTPETIRTALSLLTDRRVPGDKFIQREAGLEEVPSILADLAVGRGAVKTAILP